MTIILISVCYLFVCLSASDDISVDWIADKMYVGEQGSGKIKEYNLMTGDSRVVVDTGGSPASVNVYPYPGQG